MTVQYTPDAINAAWRAVGQPVRAEIFDRINDDLIDLNQRITARQDVVVVFNSAVPLLFTPMPDQTTNLTLLCDTSVGGANLNVGLPAAATNPNLIFVFKKTNSDAYSVVLTPHSSEKIDTASSYTISQIFDTIAIQSDGSNWQVLYASKAQRGAVPIGAVLATFPNLAGTYQCTSSPVSGADAAGFVLCNGLVLSDIASPMNGVTIPNINNAAFLMGNVYSGTPAATVTGGSNSTTLTTTQLPAHTHDATGLTDGITWAAGSLPSLTASAAPSGHTHLFGHVHQIAHFKYNGGDNNGWFNKNAQDTDSTSVTTSDVSSLYGTYTDFGTVGTDSGHGYPIHFPDGLTTDEDYYTTGVSSVFSGTGGAGSGNTAATGVNNGTDVTLKPGSLATLTHSGIGGSTASSGSGTAYDSRPAYVTATYLMRVR